MILGSNLGVYVNWLVGELVSVISWLVGCFMTVKSAVMAFGKRMACKEIK